MTYFVFYVIRVYSLMKKTSLFVRYIEYELTRFWERTYSLV